jgi:hypothetical protein
MEARWYYVYLCDPSLAEGLQRNQSGGGPSRFCFYSTSMQPIKFSPPRSSVKRSVEGYGSDAKKKRETSE